MAILARYQPLDIVVQVVDVLHTAGGRKMAAIRATEGEPFTVNTHGGPMATACAIVNPDQLGEVHQAPKPQRKSPGKIRPMTEGEWAAFKQRGEGLFPTLYNTAKHPATPPARPALGGMNND